MTYNKIRLSDFLHYFDFSFVLNGNRTFSLVDLQQANLANIEDDEFLTDKNGVAQCIERLDTYIYDYTIRFLNENTDFQFDTVRSALKFAENSKENELVVRYWCDMDILNAVCHPDSIILDFMARAHPPAPNVSKNQNI